ncbi:hypothetical protein HIM_00868 [Hirsutella minnesotensis 3608]|nr:hypothetical protein HIM_00868 [Hirsutella minnesotensis 3608]
MANSGNEKTAALHAHSIRICKIAGRYLVFDPEAVAIIRRKHNISGTLVGTTPQQPTQNIFLGLPVELRPEEADALAQIGTAFIVDDVVAHREALSTLTSDHSSRRAYVESLRRRRMAARDALADRSAKKVADFTERQGLLSSTSEAKCCSKFGRHERPSALEADSRSQAAAAPSVTLVSSSDLCPRANFPRPDNTEVSGGALCRFLQSGGYYMTPGLRFGSQYSVYPGDPLRFHAHFMAVEYAWNESIAILDIVGGGRLATAVKKSFLVGGEEPCRPTSQVRTYSIEWAAM